MEKLPKEVAEQRKPEHEIHPIILGRWSPRSMTGEEIPDDKLMPLFEAARWAPSSYNNQPWRFIYAKRNSRDWKKFFDLLTEGNQAWAKNAAVLVVLISAKNFEFNGKPSITHMMDAGSAWENLAIEGSRRGLVTHGIEGFDYGRARKELEISDDYDICCIIAIGKRGKKEALPAQMQEYEKPNQRKPLKDIIMEGKWK